MERAGPQAVPGRIQEGGEEKEEKKNSTKDKVNLEISSVGWEYR